jgi:hypothetical protein
MRAESFIAERTQPEVLSNFWFGLKKLMRILHKIKYVFSYSNLFSSLKILKIKRKIAIWYSKKKS